MRSQKQRAEVEGRVTGIRYSPCANGRCFSCDNAKRVTICRTRCASSSGTTRACCNSNIGKTEKHGFGRRLTKPCAFPEAKNCVILQRPALVAPCLVPELQLGFRVEHCVRRTLTLHTQSPFVARNYLNRSLEHTSCAGRTLTCNPFPFICNRRPARVMAGHPPELAARLQELDHELEEGDITQKGCVAAVAVAASVAPVALPRSTPPNILTCGQL